MWITQPRQPCYKLDRRWHRDDLSERAADLGRIGWYFAVRQPGSLQAGDAVELLERPNPHWPMVRVWAVYREMNDVEAINALAQASGLSEKLRGWLMKKLAEV